MNKTNPILLSIVIPALNEEKTIGLVINKASKAIKKLGVQAEIIVVDNGSTDRTEAISRELGARVITVAEQGYGSALQHGFEAAQGQYLLMADADDSYDLESIEGYIQKLDEGHDLVMGNRYKGKFIPGAMPFLHRYLGTPVLTWIMNTFFKTGIGDVNCGMRAIRREAYQLIQCQALGMEFATEMIIKASLMKLRITEIPCTLDRDKRGRSPHLKTWSDGWRHLRFMLLFFPFQLFLIPGVLLFALGFLGLVLLPIGSTYFDSNHLITSVLIILTGAQIIEFWIIAKVFSSSRHFDRSDGLIIFIQDHFKLERGLMSAMVIIVISLLILITLFATFKPEMLGDPALRLLRFKWGIWGVTGLLLGAQIIFTSFLLSLFYLKVK